MVSTADLGDPASREIHRTGNLCRRRRL